MDKGVSTNDIQRVQIEIELLSKTGRPNFLIHSFFIRLYRSRNGKPSLFITYLQDLVESEIYILINCSRKKQDGPENLVI